MEYYFDKCVSTRLRRCINTSSMESLRLSIRPNDVLMNERVSVQVLGLESRQKVTMHASIKGSRGEMLASSGCYQATTDGTLDLENMPSTSGTYTGVDGMGFIWSMLPSPGQRPGVQLLHTDVTEPQLVNISFYNGHHCFEDLYNGLLDQPIVTDVLTRWYKSRVTTRIPITSGRLRGTLFVTGR
ncbi:bile acid-CoA:amino acid N-acyltransferase-like [Pecten maximus]|uniref:bile acid-CoA:amino acid N-acyltransferase-like n=1 Tax=Pecten maximus TaxID=6579 RepID=UPI001458BB8E|nr:bile acid-CoA:amino acid N-acyltransferase-like [Pecten maximus]